MILRLESGTSGETEIHWNTYKRNQKQAAHIVYKGSVLDQMGLAGRWSHPLSRNVLYSIV